MRLSSPFGSSRGHKDIYYRGIPCTLPKDLDLLRPGNWLNFGNVNDQRIFEDVMKMDNLIILQEAEANRIGRELISYILEQSYVIALPVPDAFNFWQPWVRNYHGEISLGLADLFTWAKYVWIDQDVLKTKTGSTR